MKKQLLGAGTALLLSACVESGTALVIAQNQVPQVDDKGCKIPAEKTQLRLAIGTLDVALDQPYPYEMYPLLENRLPAFTSTGKVDLNRIDVSSYQVTIQAPPSIQVAWSPACPPRFDFPSPVLLEPGGNYATIVEAMRPCHSDLLRQLFQQGKLSPSFAERIFFTVKIRAKGRHGGTEILSDPFEFPIRVCYGCLQTGFSDTEFVQFNFPQVPPCARLAANPYIGNTCNPAQDMGPILCCAKDAMGQQLECPAVPRIAPMRP